MKRLVVALGGNAIIQAGQRGTAEEQQANVDLTCRQLAELVAAGYELIITHGNGPQVGNLLVKNELAREVVPPVPLHWCVAQTQATIGFMIQQALGAELQQRGIERVVATLVTRTEVSPDDPAWREPTKPIGLYYPEERARAIMAATGQVWKPQGSRGWRRVVPSPDPIAIVDRPAIELLLGAGAIVVACGGGGIPVVRRTDGRYEGVEAVIDKDLAAALLAHELGADALVILTDVPSVMLYYGTPEARPLEKVTVEELRRYQADGHFASGSMGPKVEAAIRFVSRKPGRRAVIAALDHAREAVEGRSGTQVIG
ncbi:carbamate kinase [Thermomicrobium sp. 4228-Ro]|uniref:carbamate kinase n=1 Tax=Thermomicrobium sp. 4228-Ro TaxID=2993937 RepID=UPI0022490F53|nr:carbamate kinase [Thermomicrobium sp. 4228-Ro]MCX2726295.1 carbamate kinase [Thermomicrobium sp. 4228-Ro]